MKNATTKTAAADFVLHFFSGMLKLLCNILMASGIPADILTEVNALYPTLLYSATSVFNLSICILAHQSGLLEYCTTRKNIQQYCMLKCKMSILMNSEEMREIKLVFCFFIGRPSILFLR